MDYHVKLTPQAEADMYAAYEYVYQQSPQRAEKWIKLLFEAISTLDTMPARCALIPENDAFNREIRQLLFGKRSGTYRIIFDILEMSEDGPTVRILRFRHGSRDRLQVEDLDVDDV